MGISQRGVIRITCGFVMPVGYQCSYANGLLGSICFHLICLGSTIVFGYDLPSDLVCDGHLGDLNFCAQLAVLVGVSRAI